MSPHRNILKRLSQNDTDLLQKIFEYGGYTTSLSISNYRNNISSVAVFYILKKLVDNGYLKEIPFYSDSRRNVLVYQVTSKTCKLFDQPNSYYRKNHDDSYIIRALMKQHFLFEICTDYVSLIIANHAKRVELLTQDLGVEQELLPKKYNKGSGITHVEEYLLDLRKSQVENLCKSNNSLTCCPGINNRLFIVYIDKPSCNVTAQLMTVIERYRNLINLHEKSIGFLVIVDTEKRQDSYTKAIKKMTTSNNNANGMLETLITNHVSVLKNKLHLESNKLVDLPSKIKKKYSYPQELGPGDFTNLPIEQLKSGNYEVIEDFVDSILCTTKVDSDRLNKITEFFRKLYKLEACGEFSSSKALSIQIFRIGYTFSLN